MCYDSEDTFKFIRFDTLDMHKAAINMGYQQEWAKSGFSIADFKTYWVKHFTNQMKIVQGFEFKIRA